MLPATLLWAAAADRNLSAPADDPFYVDPFFQPPRAASPASFLAPSREATIAAFEHMGAQHASMFSSASLDGVVNQSSGGKRKRRARESGSCRAERLLSDDFLNAAMQGQTILPNGSHTSRLYHGADKCGCKLSDGSPCWSNLWSDRDQYEQHLQLFEGAGQEARSAEVYEQLRGAYYADEDASGNASGAPYWHYRTGRAERRVCKDIFLLSYPIGNSTLFKLQRRLKSGAAFAHAKSCKEQQGSGDNVEPVADLGACSVIGWYRGYARVVGDWMPDEQQQIVPRRERREEWKEYCAAVGTEHAVKESYFVKIIKCVHRCRLSALC